MQRDLEAGYSAQYDKNISASDAKYTQPVASKYSSCVSNPLCWPGKLLYELISSPLLGAELVELLTGSLQQPEASKVPTADDEHRYEKNRT